MSDQILVRLPAGTGELIDAVAGNRNRAAWVRSIIAHQLHGDRPTAAGRAAGPTRRRVRYPPALHAVGELYGQVRMAGGAVVQLCQALRECGLSVPHRETEIVLRQLRAVISDLAALIDRAGSAS